MNIKIESRKLAYFYNGRSRESAINCPLEEDQFMMNHKEVYRDFNIHSSMIPDGTFFTKITNKDFIEYTAFNSPDFEAAIRLAKLEVDIFYQPMGTPETDIIGRQILESIEKINIYIDDLHNQRN